MGIGLTVDWDFFMDWVPENAEYTNYHSLYAWAYRPEQKLNTFPTVFFEKLLSMGFQFKRPRLLICDNHGHAYKFFSRERYVVSFDAHTDCYDSPITRDSITCGNWLHHWAEDYQRNAMVVLPEDYDWRQTNDSDRVFVTNWRRFSNHTYSAEGYVSRIVVCRSSPWTHPMYDIDFVRLCDWLCKPSNGIEVFGDTWIEDVGRERPYMKLSPESLVGSLDATDWFGAITTSVAPRRLTRKPAGRLTKRRTTR